MSPDSRAHRASAGPDAPERAGPDPAQTSGRPEPQWRVESRRICSFEIDGSIHRVDFEGRHNTMKSSKYLNRREWLTAAAGAGTLFASRPISAQSAKVQLSMCLSDNDRTRPLRDGRVKADGLDLVISTAHPSEMFWRELHFAEFDVSEMSCSSLLMAVAHGDKRFVA